MGRKWATTKENTNLRKKEKEYSVNKMMLRIIYSETCFCWNQWQDKIEYFIVFYLPFFFLQIICSRSKQKLWKLWLWKWMELSGRESSYTPSEVAPSAMEWLSSGKLCTYQRLVFTTFFLEMILEQHNQQWTTYNTDVAWQNTWNCIPSKF